MKVTEHHLDRESLSSWCKRDLSNQPVEVFSCTSCRSIFIGLPDEHTVFCNPTDAHLTSFYNGAGPIRCPSCRNVWYQKGFSKYRVQEVTVEDFTNSPWSWLLGTTRD
jgi:hypothetical protein